MSSDQPGETKRYCLPPISSLPRGVSSKSAQRPVSSTRRFFAQAAASVEPPVAEAWSTSTRMSGEPEAFQGLARAVLDAAVHLAAVVEDELAEGRELHGEGRTVGGDGVVERDGVAVVNLVFHDLV